MSDITEIGHFVGGRTVGGTSGNTSPVYNPATGQQTGAVALASVEELDAAVAVANAAFQEWRSSSVAKRTEAMFNLRNLVKQNASELAAKITAEHGKVHSDAMGEVARGLENIEFACNIGEMLKGSHSNQVSTGVDVTTIRRPLGVVAVDNRSFQFVDDCGSSQPWDERARLEDARAIVRADGSYALVYTRVGRREAHVMHSVPLVVDATARTARAALERRVELCTALLDRLGESTFQKNWAPFSYGGRDYVVYSIAPLRVWRVDHDTGACEVAAAAPAAALEALVRNCSAIDALDGHAEQTEAWRRCTGSRQQFPKQGRTLRRATLSLAGGTPGVAVAPRDLGLGGEAPGGVEWR